MLLLISTQEWPAVAIGSIHLAARGRPCKQKASNLPFAVSPPLFFKSGLPPEGATYIWCGLPTSTEVISITSEVRPLAQMFLTCDKLTLNQLSQLHSYGVYLLS